MSRNVWLVLLVSAFICSGFLGFDSSFAQPIWLDRSHDNTISLEILKPDFEGDSDLTLTTSAWFLSGRFSGHYRMSWVYEVPFAHYGYDSEYSDESDNAIGNPYLGVEFYGEGSPIFGEIGLRLPLAPDFDNGAVFIGYFTDFVDRVEAFVPDVLTASGFVNYMKRQPSGFFSRLRCGLTLLVATEKHAESEQCLLYSAQAGYESEEAGFLAGVSGRYVLSEEDGDFGERTTHQLGLAVSASMGAVQPGISLRVPLDEDLSDWLDFVFGLTIGVPVG